MGQLVCPPRQLHPLPRSRESLLVHPRELGRQVQREAKHRQNIETQLHNLETNGPEVSSRDHGFDPDVDRRLSRCENLAQEVKKDLRKEKKRFEKIQSQTEAQMKNQIDQKTIEVGAK